MSLFNFGQEEMLSFFGVLVRISVLFAVLPFVGDRVVPVPVKILLALTVSIVMFPMLVGNGLVRPGDAFIWGANAGGIIGTVAVEVLVGLALGFTAKVAFDAISVGSSLVGGFMGFSSASMYDPHQETQTHVIAEFQLALAMLLFLTLDGHHLMLRAALESYRTVGLGSGQFILGSMFGSKLIQVTGYTIMAGVQMAAPVAIALFAVNVAFGVLAKAMPQLNVLMLSFGASALVGLLVLFLTLPEFQNFSVGVLGKTGEMMQAVLTALVEK